MRTRTLAACLALIAAPAADAMELADGKLNLNGNGAWAYQRTDRGAYLAGDEGEWQNAMFDLLLTARPAERLAIVAQLGFDPEEIELEWGFAEWRFSDLARVRAGKVKQPFGNYGETYFIGTARPFFTLPSAVYGPTEMAASAVSGVGVTGDWYSEDGWGLGYDAYGGALELPIFEPWAAPPEGVPAEGLEETALVNDIVGGRLSLTTPWGVVVRLSGYGGRLVSDEGEAHTLVTSGASVFYRGEKLWLSIEGFHSGEFGHERQLGGYAEAAWFVTPRLQVAARWEAARVTLDEGDAPAALRRHDEGALGVGWWFTPEMVARVSVHAVKGFRFATPEDAAELGDDRTLLFVAGTQFTF